MKRGTILLIAAIAIGFGIELATNSVGNENALLKLGALPDDGRLQGEYWRIAAYSFLHFNWLHLIINLALLWWLGRMVEKQFGIGRGALIYFVSVISSAVVILLVHNWHPKEGATVGASGGAFGLLGAALIISTRQNDDAVIRKWLYIVAAAGFGVSLLPNISMAGHIGGIIGGIAAAIFLRQRDDEN
jgi:membrane associated rhomboid family serine protease